MRRSVQALFDGEVLRPAEPLDLPPDFAAQPDRYLYGTPKR
jgi:hypothetical protein